MICSKCKCDKTEEDFPWKKKDVKRSTTCKICQRVYKNAYYNTNKDKVILNNKNNKKKVRQELKDLVNAVKKSGCLVCKEKELVCLDFHHLDPNSKDYTIAKLTGDGLPSNKHLILEEIKKCIVVCSNCHRKIHANILNINDYLA